MKDNFSFVAPIFFEKGIDGKEPLKLVIGGIASTTSKDFDGEFMNPKGFDTSYFERFGFINWAHQTNKDPLAIVGRPTKVTVDQRLNELYIEATLFKSSEKAMQVYKLGQILEEEGHSLAFSIEGKVTLRDKKNPKKVLKAVITGCAITPTPKNNDSVASIIKGLDDDEFGFIKGMYSAFEEEDEDDKDKDKKKKSMDTASIAPLTKESVDKKVKNTVGAMLTKSQVMTILREDLPNTSEEMLEEVYKLTLTIEKSVIMEKAEISPESLNKAYATLGVEKGVESTEVESTEETPANEAEEVETPEAEVEKSTEAETEKEEVESTDSDIEKDLTPSDEAVEASKTILKAAGYDFSVETEKEVVEEKTTTEPEAKEVVEKAIGSPTEEVDIAAILKQELGSLQKGFGNQFQAVGTLFKGLEAKIESVAAENVELKKSIDAFGLKTQGKKSVTTSAYIEKGIATEEGAAPAGETPANALSISNPMHKRQILKIADDACGISKGHITNAGLAEETAMYETSNFIEPKGQLVKALSEAGHALVN